VVIGSAGNALGKLATGWVVQKLQSRERWSPVRSYQAVFLAYAGLGFLNLLLTCTLSSRVELHGHDEQKDSDDESESLISGIDTDSNHEMAGKEKRSLLPKISKESRIVLLKLCLLFALDSLASGLVPA
jgi:hypothetical protein